MENAENLTAQRDVRLSFVENTLDQLSIPPGPLFSRMMQLLSRDRVHRRSLNDATVSRVQAIDRLQALMREDNARTQDTESPFGDAYAPVGLIADVVKRYQVRVHSELQRVISDLANMQPNYLDIDPVRDLVMASQELMEATDRVLEDMRDCFPKGDPLLRSLREASANTYAALLYIRQCSGVKGAGSNETT
jgi:hypothetical protein